MGCAIPTLSDSMTVRREGGTLYASCNNSQQQPWKLECEGNKWVGRLGNCTPGTYAMTRTAVCIEAVRQAILRNTFQINPSTTQLMRRYVPMLLNTICYSPYIPSLVPTQTSRIVHLHLVYHV